MKIFSIIFILILLSVISSGCQTVLQSQESLAVATSAATLLDSAAAEPSPTATEKPMTLQEKVDAFAAGKIEFPSDLSPEEYSAFIDGMNDHVGRQAIWVETFKNKDGSPVVLYFDTEKSDMVALPGSYEENKDTVDRNQLEVFVKISEEPDTGNLQYFNSDGELITSPNSANVNWNLRVDSSNYEDGLIDLPKVTDIERSQSEDWYSTWWNRLFVNKNNNNLTLVPAILIDNKVSKVVSFQGGWNEYACLNLLFIIANEQGESLYGIRKMYGPAPGLFLGFEGSNIELSKTYDLRETDTIKKFEAGAIYYAGIRDQQISWDDLNRSSIENLQGVSSTAKKYDETLNDIFPEDGNIILAGGIIVKKK